MGILDSNPDRKLSPDVPEDDIKEVNDAVNDAFGAFLKYQDWGRLEKITEVMIRQFGQHCFEQGKRSAFESLKN